MAKIIAPALLAIGVCRNLIDCWKYQIKLNRQAELLEQGRVKNLQTVGRPSKESLSIVDNDLPKHNTREILAEELGWSTGKVVMADKVWSA